MWWCPAEKLVARVVSWVEQRDLRAMVCVFLCVPLSAVEQDGDGAGEWHCGGSQELCWELHPRAELGCGMSRAGARAARALLGNLQTGNPARVGLRVPHFGVCLGCHPWPLVVALEEHWVKWGLCGFRGLAKFLKCVPVT